VDSVLYELIKASAPLDNLNPLIDNPKMKSEFGDKLLSIHWCTSVQTFKTIQKYDLWHSVNQNSKIEPI
jgi:hypothetical protein